MSTLGIVGECLLTLGVIVLLFLVWKLWWNDSVIAAAQTSAADQHVSTWAKEGGVTTPVGPAPIVRAEPRVQGAVIGVLRIPRYGKSYARTIAEGTTTAELSTFALGVGHYVGTQMPGQVGNFAIAGHRSAYGGAMHLMDKLKPGDPIVVETRDGWYTYRFVRRETVLPSAIGAVDPVPWHPGEVAHDRTITLTTCTPLYSTAFRYVSFGTFVSFRARATHPAASTEPTASAARVEQ